MNTQQSVGLFAQRGVGPEAGRLHKIQVQVQVQRQGQGQGQPDGARNPVHAHEALGAGRRGHWVPAGGVGEDPTPHPPPTTALTRPLD